QTESFIEAIHKKTGEIVWHKQREGFKSSWSTPIYWNNNGTDELLVYGVSWLTALDLEDGSDRWAVPGLADEPAITPVVGDGLVFVSSYNMKTNTEVIGLPAYSKLLQDYDTDKDGQISFREGEANESVLSRYDADGEGDHPLRLFYRMLDSDGDKQISENEYEKLIAWLDGFEQENGLVAIRPAANPGDKAEIVWRHRVGVPEIPSPLYHAGLIYLVKNGGMVTCLDAKTGEKRYQARLGAGGPYYASPIFGDSKIYTASARGVITVFEAGDTLRVLARNQLNERVMATPAIVDGQIYVRTESRLIAFGL
ncbi:PQQ-binding-like beta-propeller repeat protein, partial [bacterium]|nr:PQQ-binding-like beta-propeller repeat protein [bacterium]